LGTVKVGIFQERSLLGTAKMREVTSPPQDINFRGKVNTVLADFSKKENSGEIEEM